MCYFCCPKEIDPVALAERVHVEWVLALYFIGLPVFGEDIVATGLKEFLGSEIGQAVFVLCVEGEVPTGSMIFLMSKWCL